MNISFTKHTLANGLDVLLHEDHACPIVAVNLWYHVGSKNERPGHTGFAHLFEHLMFNGSENFNDDYFKATEPLGATDLPAARDRFGALSEAIDAYMTGLKLTPPEGVRVAVCPMVNKPWLQKGDALANPYYGKEMLTCGNFR